MYTDMKWWLKIRQRVLNEEVSKREILRETGIHWKTLEKILAHSEPPGYRRQKPVHKPKLGPYEDRIRQFLLEDRGVPRKQRHTAKRVFERLQEEGYQGGYTQVKEAVREIRQRSQEVFVPLIHQPGEAQVDFGYALIREAGQLRKVVYFVMGLPYSDAMFVQVFERICTEVFWEGHRRAFEFLGGVPLGASPTTTNASSCVRSWEPTGENSATGSCSCKVITCSRNTFARCVGPTKRAWWKAW